MTQMTWNNIESNWKSLKATIQQNWTQLTDEDLNKINGNRDLLISTIQEKYASNRSDAETEVQNWQSSQTDSDSQQGEPKGTKYNPDYSGSDSNLVSEDDKNSAKNKPGSINDNQNDDQESQHDEKSLDQT